MCDLHHISILLDLTFRKEQTVYKVGSGPCLFSSYSRSSLRKWLRRRSGSPSSQISTPLLISAAILLSRIVFETVRRSIVIAREAFNQANVTSSFVFPEERRLFVRVTHAHFNRPDVSLAV
jgi:hypothetical protein